ncbi:HEAT repeat domain-containing protein [Elusimicrobiota bacterium]
MITSEDITDREYERLGTIKAAAKKLSKFHADPTRMDVNKELEEEARKIGADAVIQVEYSFGVGLTSWGVARANGVAIRFLAGGSESRAALEPEGGSGAMEQALRGLQDASWRNRVQAAETLGEVGDPNAVTALIDTLSDNNLKVRNASARALGRIGDLEALGPLQKRLAQDPSAPVRGWAACGAREVGAGLDSS